TKFSQVSVFSGFNQPKDISMHRAYETLCGITQKELEEDLKEPVMQMAEEHHCTYEKMLDKLKENYDGYHFSER
ncbi:AAA family ATPase, partial [Bacteroides caecigallinarum]